MREFTIVIDKMLAVIPDDEIKLREALIKAKQDSYFRAPEVQIISFRDVAEILGHRFGDAIPTEGWQKQMDDIWFDREEGEGV